MISGRFFRFVQQLSPLNRFLVYAVLMVVFYYSFTLSVYYFPLFTRFASAANILIRSFLIRSSDILLKTIGYETIRTHEIIGIINSTPIYMAPLCFGWRSMYVFAAFILIYPGNPSKKIFFIIAGLLLINLSNVLRISLLAMANHHGVEMIKPFLHKYFVKLIIFSLWLIWLFGINKSQRTLVQN